MTTYTELKDLIIATLNDDSTEAADYVPTAVALTERNIFNMVSGLECFKQTEEPIALNSGTDTAVLSDSTGPHEIIRAVGIRETGDDYYKPLEKRPDEIVSYFQQRSGEPRFYRVDERDATTVSITVAPVQASTDYQLEIRSFGLRGTLDPDTGSSQSWLSIHATEAMQYGACYHLSVFLKRPAMEYKEMFELAVMALAKKENLQVATETDSGVKEASVGGEGE